MVEEMKENSQFAQKQLSDKEGFITYRFTSSSTRPINQEEAEELNSKGILLWPSYTRTLKNSELGGEEGLICEKHP